MLDQTYATQMVRMNGLRADICDAITALAQVNRPFRAGMLASIRAADTARDRLAADGWAPIGAIPRVA
jgi:hypothetical protein